MATKHRTNGKGQRANPKNIARDVKEAKFGIKGIFRIQTLNPDGTVDGDTGWKENQITQDGVRYFLSMALGGSAGSSQITHAALGTGTAPASNAATLPGEITGSTKRQAVTYTSTGGSFTAKFTGTFASSDSFLTAASTLQNIGLFPHSSSGQIFAGNTYATSAVATNQNVNFTYDILFTT